jgi:hypothetical protein
MKHYVYDAPFEMVDKDGNKYTLRVEQDDMANDPREWDNVAKMICWHRHYNLGDKHDYDDSFEFLIGVAKEIGIFTDDMWDMEQEELEEKVLETDLVVIVPLNLYDHSGITMSTSNGYPYNDRWDAGCVGYAYITKKKAMEELCEYEVDENGNRIKIEHKHPNGMVTYSSKTKPLTDETWRARAREVIDAEVETYDQYLCGDVYGFILEKEVVVEEKCPHCGVVIKTYTTTEEEDSCWGFYGECLEENGILDYITGLEFVD